jgi:hypothetical protein
VTDGRDRALAVTILEDGTATGWRKGEALHLLARTFSAGDAARIAALLDAWRDADADDLHGLGYGALAALGAHPVPEAAPALLTLYGYSPCSHCRERYVDLLQQMGQLSEWGTKRNSL